MHKKNKIKEQSLLLIFLLN